MDQKSGSKQLIYYVDVDSVAVFLFTSKSLEVIQKIHLHLQIIIKGCEI